MLNYLSDAKNYLFLFLLICGGASETGWGNSLPAKHSEQEADATYLAQAVDPSSSAATVPSQDKVELPRGFSGVVLGTDYEQVKDVLKRSSVFFLEPEPDIYLLPEGEQRVLQVSGAIDAETEYQFIQEAYFQFNKDDVLVAINIFFNRNLLDYFTLFQVHKEKYGATTEITPNKAVWEDTSIKLILEKPLALKYLLKSFIADTTVNVNKTPNIARKREEYREAFLSLF